MSIRSRLLLYLISGVLLVLALGGTGLYLFTAERLRAEFRASLFTQAQVIAATVVIDHGEIDIEASELGNLSQPYSYLLIGVHGEALVQSGQELLGRVESAGLAAGEHRWYEAEFPGDRDGIAVIYAFEPSVERDGLGESAGSNGSLPTLRLVVSRETETLDESIAVIGAAITGFGVLILGVTGGLVWVVVQAGLRPLDHLAAAIGEIESDSLLAPKPPIKAPRELLPAYIALDQALGRVSDAMQRERRFTDAAAHELRTPISELRTALEVAKRWPEPERITRALGQADAVLMNMTDLIESLLILSRSNSNVSVDELAPESVGKIVRTEIDRIRVRAEQAGIEITDSNQGPEVMWPKVLGQIVVRNLLYNAIEYTPQGGQIEISSGDERLSVLNRPVDLNPEQVRLMFEPFWRVEASRTDRKHHGLGLAIVRHVAIAIGYSCHAEVSGDSLMISLELNRTDRNDTEARNV